MPVVQDAHSSKLSNPKSAVWGHDWKEKGGGSILGSLGESGSLWEAAEVMGEVEDSVREQPM